MAPMPYFVRKSAAAALLKFFDLSVRRLFEGGTNSGVALITYTAYLRITVVSQSDVIILNLCFVHNNSIGRTQ